MSLAVWCLGFSALLTQLTLMRELLGAFAGSELVFGIVLGNWLLLTGIGSALGKSAAKLKSPLAVLILAQILVAVLPIVDVFLLRTLRNVVFLRGAAVGLTETVAASFVLLAPYCLIAGYLLTLACQVLSPRREPESIGQVYFLDAAGSVVAGLLFSFVLIFWFDHFGILYFPAVLNLLAAGAMAFAFRRRVLLAATACVAAVVVGLLVFGDLDAVSARVQYAGQQIVFRGNSPYGSLVVTQSAGQHNFIENGVLLFSTQNVEEVEETVHYAMAQRPDAKRVLLISGGVSGTAREILKYGASVDYVELDPLILQVAQRLLPERLADPGIRVIQTDGRLFIKQTQERYDVVIVDVPDPSTFQINRFYTREFLTEAARKLGSDGVLCFALGQYDDYVGPELARLMAVAHRTLKEVFAEVLIIPGGRMFFLGSNGALTTDIAARIQSKGIRTRLVKRDYLKAMLTPDRLADVQRAVSAAAPVNEDFNPILYYYHLLYWITQFKVRFGLLEAALVGILVVYLLRIRAVPLAIFTTGFAASALEVVLLMCFQILYGSLYHQVALIVTMFMLGLGIGCFAMNRLLSRRSPKDLFWLQLAIAALAACLPLVLWGLGRVEGASAGSLLPRVVIPMATLLLAALVGLEFPLAGKADFQSVATTAARIYTADFIGAALGALLVSTLLIPVMGVAGVCFLAAGMNVVSGIVVLAKVRA